jgi:ribosomal-protein-alanine N-acetyltransferase
MIVAVEVATKIRLMRVDDLPQVQAIDEISFSSPWPKTAFRHELLENPNAYCWVAEVEGRVVALMVCWLILDEAHIATIAVHPAQRGRGISKALVVSGLLDLISKGAVSATLEVRAGNYVAQNLYRYFGFKEVGLRKSYYQDTKEDALLMTVQPLDPDYVRWLNAGAENPWQGSTSS